MFQTRTVTLVGILGLFVSWIVIGSLTGSRISEASLEPTSCLHPPAKVQIARPSTAVPISVQQGGSNYELPLELAFSRLGKNNAGKDLTYAIGIRPVQTEHVEPELVATGQVDAGQNSINTTIAVKNATLGSSFELTVEIAPQVNGSLGRTLGKDLIYVTAVPGAGKTSLGLQFFEAAKYWYAPPLFPSP
jgi:hypothetical protein